MKTAREKRDAANYAWYVQQDMHDHADTQSCYYGSNEIKQMRIRTIYDTETRTNTHYVICVVWLRVVPT